MSGQPTAPPPGWYPAKGDPPGTKRYWNGSTWEGGHRPVPGVAVGDAFPLADLARRLAARLIDVVIWIAATIVIDRIVGWSLGGAEALSTLLAGAAIVGYEAFSVGRRGATVGKRALGLAVVAEDGAPADLAAGLRRAGLLGLLTVVSIVPFLWVLSFVAVPLLVLVGMLMIYADDRQQTPWDKLGRTLVVMR
jgi:uncharacterized RDD family membrane protein YckC